MDIIQYKGYAIQAAPLQLADNGQWQINIQILRHSERETVSRNFSAGDSYARRDDAVKNCFQFGRQIIDGQSPNCSVTDL